MTPHPDPAAKRFWIIQAVRIFGAALAVCGLIVMAERLPEIPRWSGALLLVGGTVLMMIMPRKLARRWRTPPGS